MVALQSGDKSVPLPTWMGENNSLWSIQEELIIEYLRVYRENVCRENMNASVTLRKWHEKSK